MLKTFLFALLLQQTPSNVPAPQKLWESTFPDRVLSVSIASSGSCIATLTDKTAEVRNEDGRSGWSQPVVGDALDIAFGRVAVSPQCDWTAVFLSRNTRPPTLQIFGRDRSRMSISLDAMVGLDANSANVSSLSISPDGKLAAVGFESGRIWIVTRSGTIQTRLGPLPAPQIDAEFTPDGKRLVMKGWYTTGLMDFDGQWSFQSGARNLAASRNLSLFATLTSPMHGPQGGDIAILDAQGKILWKEMSWNASMAIAPDGSFVAFATTPEKAPQVAGSAVSWTPALADTSEIRLRDKSGKILATRTFNGWVVGVSSDSRCILVEEKGKQDLVGLNRQLVEVWRLPNAQSPHLEGGLILELDGNKIRASRMPPCR